MQGEEQSTLSIVGPLLLLGAPGVGKGTQAKLLMDRFAIPQISTGDLLRGHVREGTELGRTAKALMDAGQFVPDATVNAMVATRLAEPDARTGYVLDGYPRTIQQAEWLDVHLSAAGMGLPLAAVQIVVPEESLLQRITGRRSCPVCKRIYNIYLAPPQVPGVCDVEGAVLDHRPDDTEAAFGERMREFRAKTADVIEHYKARGSFRAVRGEGTIADVEASVIAALRQLRGVEARTH